MGPEQTCLSVGKAAGLFTCDLRPLLWLLAHGLVCPASQKSLYLPEVGGVSCFRTEVLSKLFHLARRETVGTKLMGMWCMGLMVKLGMG